jgi:CRP/FNR family cyclic AMP-dependent transcriptional regulator
MKLLKVFRDWKDVVEFSAQNVIFPEGKPADVLYVIISGEVELTLRSERLGTEGVGGLIGEMAITHSATRSTTATALTDVKLARLTRYQLNMLMTKSTDLALHVMAGLANRLVAVNHHITVQLDSVQ